MEERLVTRQTAQLAKEKGFNWKCAGCFVHPPKWVLSRYGHIQNYNKFTAGISAPTQAHLQQWLREEHEIQIMISFGSFGSSGFGFYHGDVFCLTSNHRTKKINWEGDETQFRSASPIKNLTHEEALEVALQEALNLI